MKISIFNDIIPLITSTWFQEHTLIAQVAFLVQIAGKMQWNGSQTNTRSTGSLQYGQIVVI